MKAPSIVSLAIGLATAAAAQAQNASDIPYVARAFNPAHGDLPRSAGAPAQLANEEYVEALARVVYYWAYPAVDIFGQEVVDHYLNAARVEQEMYDSIVHPWDRERYLERG